LKDIELALIEENPFNSRISSDKEKLRRLANSMQRNGLLSPIRVRQHKEKYQLVFGHRRVKAARILGWKVINAEVVDLSDQQMLEYSLSENLERSDLSDLEKGLSFHRLNKEFGMTLEEIGKLDNLSRAHVCNYIRMTKLLKESTFSRNPELVDALHKISEHHARLILQIKDEETRVWAVKIVVSENLSVRDLQRMMQKLPSLFEKNRSLSNSLKLLETKELFSDDSEKERESDQNAIINVLLAEFDLPHERDFERFADLHAFRHGFSIYSSFPPLGRYESSGAFDKERDWFYEIAPYLEAKISNVRIQFFGKVSLATLYVDYNPRVSEKKYRMRGRGSVLFLKEQGSWKIIHEHWSKLEDDPEFELRKLNRVVQK
jgi:ParB family chromosome partitioning protein